MALFGSRRPNVDRLHRRDKVAELCVAARYEEWRQGPDGQVRDAGVAVRIAALDALGEREGPQVEEAATAGLADSDPRVRLAAVGLVEQAGDGAGADSLVERLTSWPQPPFEDARAAAVRVLLAAPPSRLTERFALALAKAGDLPLERERDERLLREFLHVSGDDSAPEQVAQRLADLMVDRSAPEGERERAAVILSWMGEAATHSLIRILRQPDPDLRAIDLAGAMGDSVILSDLALLCEHHDPERRARAASAIGQMQDTRGVGPLLRLTQDEAYAARRAAVTALDGFGVPGVVFGISSRGAQAGLAHAPAAEVASAAPLAATTEHDSAEPSP